MANHKLAKLAAPDLHFLLVLLHILYFDIYLVSHTPVLLFLKKLGNGSGKIRSKGGRPLTFDAHAPDANINKNVDIIDG